MAVFDILPDKNLRAVDIRDTLLANGADWSNEEVKDANYIPNYFKEGAKINIYSKRKPSKSKEIDFISTEQMREEKYSININEYNNPTVMYEDIRNGEPTFFYDYPKLVLRLSDFTGYFPKAVSPTKISKIAVVDPDYVTNFHVLISDYGDSHTVGYYDIYPNGAVYDGVLIVDGSDVWMGTNPLDFKESGLKKFQGRTVDVMPFMTNFEFKNGEINAGQIFCPIATTEPIYRCEIKKESSQGGKDYKLTVVSIYDDVNSTLTTVVQVIVYEPTNIPKITYAARYEDNGEGIALGIFDAFEGTVGTHRFEDEVGVKPISFTRPSKVTAYTDPAHRAEGGIIIPAT